MSGALNDKDDSSISVFIGFQNSCLKSAQYSRKSPQREKINIAVVQETCSRNPSETESNTVVTMHSLKTDFYLPDALLFFL